MSAWTVSIWQRRTSDFYAQIQVCAEDLFAWYIHPLRPDARVAASGIDHSLKDAQAAADAALAKLTFDDVAVAQREQQILAEHPSPSVLQ